MKILSKVKIHKVDEVEWNSILEIATVTASSMISILDSKCLEIRYPTRLTIYVKYLVLALLVPRGLARRTHKPQEAQNLNQKAVSNSIFHLKSSN